MKCVVTGGAGFLGSNLCERLIKEGHEVICIDNLLTGSEDNIKDLKSLSNFRFIKLDVCEGLPFGLEVDAIYHLASPASPNKKSSKSYHSLWLETMRVNTIGTWKLISFAQEKGAKFLFASTSEIYGDPLEHPQREEYRGNVSTTGPRAVYDESKRFGETLVVSFAREKGLDGRIVRIFNTYGPRMALDDGRVVIEFIQKALANEPLPIFGDGKQTRSFCYVDDLIDGIYKAMELKETTGEVFNLGNPDEFTVLELAEKIKQLTNSSSQFKFEELPADDPMRRCPDISKAKINFGWEPKVELVEGLKRLIDYVKTDES